MRWLFSLALCLLTGSAACLFGQLAPPNAAGVSMGHIHLIVPNPEAQTKVWTEMLGATKSGPLDLPRLPGIFIIVRMGNAQEGSNGSTVNHIGFLVRDYADLKSKLRAANIPTVFEIAKNKTIMVTFPDQIRVEFNEDPSISAPVVFHHVALMTTDPAALQAWYVKTFGGEAMTRGNVLAAKFSGGEVDFLKTREAPAPTKDRTLDHIGFEIKDLDAFCKKLSAEGMTFDVPYRDNPAPFWKGAFITDPAGTRIELTQGLDKE